MDFAKQIRRSAILVAGVCVTLVTVGVLPCQSQPDAQAKGLEEKAVSLSRTWQRNSFEQAVEALIAAGKLWNALGNQSRAIGCFRLAARLELSLGRKASALDLLETALARAEQNLSSEVDKAKVLSQLSTLYLYYGDEEKSSRYLRKATEVANRIGETSAYGELAFSTGIHHYAKEDIQLAIKQFSDSERYFHEAGDFQRESEAFIELGYSYLKSAEFDLALQSFQAARDIAKTGQDLRTETLSYQGLGKTFIARSEYGKAFDQFKTTEKLFTEDLDYSEKGALMNALSELYEQYGNLDLALDYRIKAYELFKKDGHIYGQLASISDLAQLCGLTGNPEAAETYLHDGERFARAINDEFHLARILEQKGNLHFLRSEYQVARSYLEESLVIFERKRASTPINRVKQEIGMIDIRLGRVESGRSLLNQAYAYHRSINDKSSQSEILLQFGRLSQLENKIDEAIDYARRSIELSETLYSDISNSKLRSLYLSETTNRYEFYNSLLMNQQTTPPDSAHKVIALQTAERSRSRAMLERLSLLDANFLADASAELVRQEKDVRVALNSKTDQLAARLNSDSDGQKADELGAEIRDMENRLEEVRAEIKQNSPIYSAIKNPEPFDVAEFQKNVLAEDDLLLEFSLGKAESYLWTVDKRDVTAYYLPSRAAIEARVDKLRDLLGSRQLRQGESFEEYQKRIADAEIAYESESRALSNDLLGQVPVEKLLGKKLIVVADGRLHYFPLGALPMPNSGTGKPILVTNEVVYEPSASALKIFRIERRAHAKPQKDLLVFADPVFSKSDDRIAGLDAANNGLLSTILSRLRSIEPLDSMPRLPASEEEAKSISDVVGTNQTTVRAGFEANRDGVLNGGIEDYKILHFATHGLVDEKRPELSGILLSLFNSEGKQTDGGFIRLQDVYGLHLNSDLVVLSACDTGIGKELKGEGVMSLNNAFLQAGAKSVVSSLWKVDDNATKDLMTEFYRGMADDNLTAAAALREAQIKMYNDPRYRSPFYWAAFTASGDNRVKVAFTSNAWLYAPFGALVLVFAAILASFALRRR